MNERKRHSILCKILPYTILYFIIMVFWMHFFEVRDKSLVYDGDGWRQHLRAMEYYSRWLHDLVAGIFTSAPIPGTFAFGIGYGSDIISTLAYYGVGDPLVLPAAFIAPSKIIYLYSALIIIRPYLAGMLFILYAYTRIYYNKKAIANYISPKHSIITAAALSYAFSGMVLYLGMLHPFFVIPLVIFPLILTGIERYLYDNRPSLLIFSIFLAAVSNYYFFFSEVILAAVYFVFRLSYYVQKLSDNGEIIAARRELTGKKPPVVIGLSVLGKAVIYVLTGIGMAFVVLLPVIICFLQNARHGISYDEASFYDRDYFKMLFGSLAAFYNHPINDTELGFSAALIVGMIMMVASSGHRRLKCTWLLTIILLIFPVFGKIFNGFSYSNNRWSYAIALLAGWTLVSVSEDAIKTKQIIICFITTAVLIFIEFKLGYLVTDDTPNQKNVVCSMILIVICIIAVLLLRAKRSISGYFVMAIATISVIANIYFGYSQSQGSFPREFRDKMNFEEYVEASQSTEVSFVNSAKVFDDNQGAIDNSIGRYSGIGKTISLTHNASMPYGYSSTQFNFSLANGYVSSYLNKLGILEDQRFAYFGLDDRLIPMALANVRYDCANGYDMGQYMYVPYGFAEMTELSADLYPPAIKVFKNVLPMSAGITYWGYITESQFEKMNLAQRQEALTQTVILPDEISNTFEKSEFAGIDLNYTYQDIPFDIYSLDGVVITDAAGNRLSMPVSKAMEFDDIRVDAQSESSILLTFEGLIGCETYLSVTGFTGNHGTDTMMPVRFEAYNGENLVSYKTLNYYTEYFPFRSDWHDYIINFGCAMPITAIKIIFQNEGSYSLDQIKVVCQPTDSAVENLSSHFQYQMTNVDMNLSPLAHSTDTITGTIATEIDSLMLLSIPYSRGWKLEIDGTSADLYQADIMYMAAYVPAGEHVLRIKYDTQGLRAGIIISIFCTIVWLAISIKTIANVTKKSRGLPVAYEK